MSRTIANTPASITDQPPVDESTSYHGAAGHYLSADRRDPVKKLWEEPVNHRLLADAIERLGHAPGDRLNILDVGAGAGDGLALLETALGGSSTTTINYLGLDPDPEMIDTGRALHAHREDAHFVAGDIRDELPPGDFDLYLSAGVPYSHLTNEGLDRALTGILHRIRAGGRRAIVIVDVLGRYSLEWVPNWSRDRWDYDMSFFHGASSIDATMTFHCRDSLTEAITRAVDTVGVRLTRLDLHDRSVAVGRHTSTRAFNPALPQYRPLINSLFEGDTEFPVLAARLEPPAHGAPDPVIKFFDRLARSWNNEIERTAAIEDDHGRSPRTRKELAAALRTVEHSTQRGLGAAHTLIAAAVIDPL